MLVRRNVALCGLAHVLLYSIPTMSAAQVCRPAAHAKSLRIGLDTPHVDVSRSGINEPLSAALRADLFDMLQTRDIQVVGLDTRSLNVRQELEGKCVDAVLFVTLTRTNVVDSAKPRAGDGVAHAGSNPSARLLSAIAERSDEFRLKYTLTRRDATHTPVPRVFVWAAARNGDDVLTSLLNAMVEDLATSMDE